MTIEELGKMILIVVACAIVDSILKDGFREHNRLHIAAMIMASMMQNAKWGNKYSHIARMACAAADTLLNEFKKGKMK